MGKENVNKKIKRWSEKHIHCPFNNNNNLEWAFLVWISHMIDYYEGLGVVRYNLVDCIINDFKNNAKFN